MHTQYVQVIFPAENNLHVLIPSQSTILQKILFAHSAPSSAMVRSVLPEQDQSASSDTKKINEKRSSETIENEVDHQRRNKRRRTCDDIDFLQRLVNNVDRTNRDAKFLALYEKQIELQEASLSIEKEFLNIFKNLANSLHRTR